MGEEGGGRRKEIEREDKDKERERGRGRKKVISCTSPLVITIIIYHLGCFIEYIFRLHDGARVFPVHGMW